MKIKMPRYSGVYKAVTVVAAFALMGALVPSGQPRTHTKASPLIRFGGVATPSGERTDYSLFSCQVLGLSPSATCYDPYQMRHAYGVDTLINAGFNGAGKTIVIVDAFQSPNMVAELNVFNTFYGLPSLNGLGGPANPALGKFSQIAPDGLTPFITGNDNMTGWAQEISLDVEWAHAIAPGANIVLVLAKSNNDDDMLSATRYAVDNNLGDIISQSFGENESCVDPVTLARQHEVFASATAKHITIFASSGDDGASIPSCDGSTLVKAVSSPASDALVTAVGGTELRAARYCLTSRGCNPAANPAPGTYLSEVVWNEPNIGASGGGFSVLLGTPAYQQGTLHGGKQRGVPDVSYSAAVLHGAITYLNIPGVPAGFYLFGGTSAGSPQWSALLAIADQKAGHNLGFINRALYTIGQNSAPYAASFKDITSGDNSVGAPFNIPGFGANPGWDASTGLGSPTADQLVNYLLAYVSTGDGVAAIAGSQPRGGGKTFPPGHMTPQ